MADQARQPERVRNETARRALTARGPQLVRALRALTGDRAAAIPPVAYSPPSHEQILEQALGALSRESARLLYLGAKSALEVDPVYRVLQDRSPGGDPEPWPRIQQRAETLERRGESMGAPSARRWPADRPGLDAASGHRLATECVDLAEAIRPGWEWTQLMRGIVLKSRGRYDEALDCLRPLADKGFDFEVRYWGLRNLLMALAATARWDELETRQVQLERLSRDDSALAYFEWERGLGQCDEVVSRRGLDRLGEHFPDQAGYWATLLEQRADDLAQVRPSQAAQLVDWLQRQAR